MPFEPGNRLGAKGAPLGNKNAANAKVWKGAIKRALERRTARRTDGMLEIDALADVLLEHVASGDIAAIREFGDRMDGKSPQAIVGDDDAPPVRVEKIERVVVDAANTDSEGL